MREGRTIQPRQDLPERVLRRYAESARRGRVAGSRHGENRVNLLGCIRVAGGGPLSLARNRGFRSFS